MKQHNLVKYDNKGLLHYGTISWELAKELALENKLLVLDAIYPQKWIIHETDIIDVSFDEYDNFVIQKFKTAKAKSDMLPNECIVGKLVKFNTIDGLSWYKIIRVSKTRVTLEWRGYSTCIEPVLGYGGTMNRQRCQSIIEADSQFEKLFDDTVKENHNA